MGIAKGAKPRYLSPAPGRGGEGREIIEMKNTFQRRKRSPYLSRTSCAGHAINMSYFTGVEILNTIGVYTQIHVEANIYRGPLSSHLR